MFIINRPSPDAPIVGGLRIALIDLVSSRPAGLMTLRQTSDGTETTAVQMEHSIKRFVRTPNGRGFMAVGEYGEIGVWFKEKDGKIPKGQGAPWVLTGRGHWSQPRHAVLTALFAKGRAVVFCTTGEDGTTSISLQYLDDDSASPTTPVTLPKFSLSPNDEVAMLLAVSDVDDGYGNRHCKTQRAIVITATKFGEAWVWRITPKAANDAPHGAEIIDNYPDIILLSRYVLPVEDTKRHLILQVDPMGWHESVVDWKTDTALQDMILTVSTQGNLEFWTPQLGHHFSFESSHGVPNGNYDHTDNRTHEHDPWTRSGSIHTGKANAVMARCSSRKKTVLG